MIGREGSRKRERNAHRGSCAKLNKRWSRISALCFKEKLRGGLRAAILGAPLRGAPRIAVGTQA